MAELDVGSLVVMHEGKMAGMLTFREVLLALKKHASSADGLSVGDVMVKTPVTAFPAMEANDLRRLMIEKRSRYLPVLEGDLLMGVISFLDVAKAVLEEQSFENKMLKSYIKTGRTSRKFKLRNARQSSFGCFFMAVDAVSLNDYPSHSACCVASGCPVAAAGLLVRGRCSFGAPVVSKPWLRSTVLERAFCSS